MLLAMASVLALGCADTGLSTAFTAAPAVATAIAAASDLPKPAASAPAQAAPATALAATSAASAAPGGLAFAGVSNEALVERALTALEAVTTLEGEFTQIAPSGAISTGKFYLRRPGLLRFEYEPPTPLLVVANGGMVFVRDEALETTDSYPVNQTPLKFLLRRKVELGDARLTHVDRGADDVALTFASTDAETEGEITLVMSAPDFALQEWAIKDVKGGVTVVTLENVIAGRTIANRMFQIPETGSPFLKN